MIEVANLNNTCFLIYAVLQTVISKTNKNQQFSFLKSLPKKYLHLICHLVPLNEHSCNSS